MERYSLEKAEEEADLLVKPFARGEAFDRIISEGRLVARDDLEPQAVNSQDYKNASRAVNALKKLGI